MPATTDNQLHRKRCQCLCTRRGKLKRIRIIIILDRNRIDVPQRVNISELARLARVPDRVTGFNALNDISSVGVVEFEELFQSFNAIAAGWFLVSRSN